MTTDPSRRQAIAEQVAAQEDLQRVATAVFAAGLLRWDHVNEVKAARKCGQRARVSVSQIRAARDHSRALADQLRDVLRREMKDVPAREECVAQGPIAPPSVRDAGSPASLGEGHA